MQGPRTRDDGGGGPGLPVVIDGLVCRFGRQVVVDHVSLAVEPGEHVALTGANGAGKTTLMRAVLGLHPIAAGTITVGGSTAVGAAGWAERRRLVAWMPQRPVTGRFPLLLRELLASGGHPGHAVRAAAELGLGALSERPLHTLSGGQLQRAFLARALGALGAGAEVLLADEPTAALDFAGQESVGDLLAGLGATVMVVTHDRAVTARCDRRLEMAAGRVRALA